MKFLKALNDIFLQENATGERDKTAQRPFPFHLLLLIITSSLSIHPAPLRHMPNI